MNAIDLYSGIGGWTLGLKMAGINVVKSYEWWADANRTHNQNFGLNHPVVDIRQLDAESVPATDIVVGSPPCTQFSFSNRGGSGDIQDGLVDIIAFLDVVETIQPKYWAMENVPRVAGILEKLISAGGYLHRFAYLFKDIRVVNSADFGVPQNRERMIAGNLPFDVLDSYKKFTKKLTLGNVVTDLSGDQIVDPVYGFALSKNKVTDHVLESSLSYEEERINRESKTFHPVYNVMSFPDRLDRPSRTVTALCTRVSRESIVVKDSANNLRRLSIRERASAQSFPIDYQLHSKSYGGKLKMVGNAIPPLLTFYIGQAMRGVGPQKILAPKEAYKKIKLSGEPAVEIRPDKPGRKFKSSRSFWMAIPNLRFGSGMRFDLKNSQIKGSDVIKWKVGFHYGSSKDQKELPLDHRAFKVAMKLFHQAASERSKNLLTTYSIELESIDPSEIQKCWIGCQYKNKHHPFNIVDRLGDLAAQIGKVLQEPTSAILVDEFVNRVFGDELNAKLSKNANSIMAGMIVSSVFNRIVLFQKHVGSELMAA